MSVLGEMADENKHENPYEGYVMMSTTPQLRRCSLCNQMRHSLYKVILDGYEYLFCSVAEARIGMENYKHNKEHGLTNIVTNTTGERPTIADE